MKRRAAIEPLAVLLASIFFTVIAAVLVARNARERKEARFENAVQAAQDRITGRMSAYVALLRGGAGLFAASDTVSRAAFAAYVRRLNIDREYPGVQGIGFSRRVDASGIASLEADQRANGFPDFSVFPDSARAEYHTIVYLEPMDERNRAAVGFDMSSEPTRRAAMERARDSGHSVMSGRVTLKQEIDPEKQAGFLIYFPVYSSPIVPATVAERRETLEGFVHSAFRANDLFRGIFGSESSPRVAFAVYAGERREENLLSDSRVPRENGRPEFETVDSLMIARTKWTVEYASTPYFESAPERAYLLGILLTGLLMSLALFALTRAQVKARLAAEATAQTLRESLEARERAEAEREAHATREREALEAAERARVEAEEANRAKSQFLANMSHELRTPLNAIGGYVDLLEAGIQGPLTKGQTGYLTRVRHAQHHLLGLINDVLNFARLDAGRVTYANSSVPVHDAVEGTEALILPQVHSRGLSYERAGGDPQAMVCGDRDKIQQILLNLLSNAVKFTDPGDRISVEWAVDESDVDIRVRDTGHGIAPEKLDSIFEPFVQVNADLTRASQGTGLGLSISRDLARGMSGDLVAESTLGSGSVFTLRLPKAERSAIRP